MKKLETGVRAVASKFADAGVSADGGYLWEAESN